MKKYFVRYGDFGNVYSLRWAESDTLDGYERITRNRACELAHSERVRRIVDRAFSGYADDRIYPAAWTEWNFYVYSDRRGTIDHIIVDYDEGVIK